MERTFFGRHYGWAMVVGSFVFLMVSWGVVFNSNSLFLVPIENSLGITRAETMIAITLRGIAMTVAAFAAGPLFSRFRFLSVIRVSGIGLVITYALMAWMQTAWQYYVLMVVHVAFMTLCGLIPMAMLVNRWFASQAGAALGIAMMGSGVGGMIFSLVAGQLIPSIGWRNTILVFAVQILIVMLYTQYKLFVYDPEEIGLKPFGYQEKTEAARVHVVETDEKVWGSVIFWIVAVGIVLMNIGINVLLTNTIPHLESTGISIQTLSVVSSVIMFGMAGGKVLLGILYDVAGMKIASIATSVSFIVGFLGLLLPQYPVAIWLSAIGTGFGGAFNSIAPPVFAQALYGAKNFTKVNAYFQAIGGIGMIVGPMLVGVLYSLTGNYNLTFRVFLVVMVISVFLWMIFLPSRKKKSDA